MKTWGEKQISKQACVRVRTETLLVNTQLIYTSVNIIMESLVAKMSCHLFHCQNQERWQLVDRSRRLRLKAGVLMLLMQPHRCNLSHDIEITVESCWLCNSDDTCACNQPWLCFSVIWVICSSQKPKWHHQAVRLSVKHPCCVTNIGLFLYIN